MKYLLDTRMWVWWKMYRKKLFQRVRSFIADPGQYEELLLSAISCWEFSKLLEKMRIGISGDPEEWI